MLTNTDYNLILVFLYSLFATWVAIEYFIPRLKKYGYVVDDHYKKGNVKIPTMGGIAMFAGIMVSLALFQLLIKGDIVGNLFIFYFIVLVYAMYGLIDDLFSFKKRYDKILVLLVLSLPIASLISHNSINILGFELFLNGFVPYLIAPVFIMVVANLINVNSGFNGLDTGLVGILLIFVAIKSYTIYGLDNLIFILPALGALIAFFPFNFCPAKILPGNSGQFLLGSALGAALIVNRLEFFGIIILIPHIVNFLMDTYSLKIKKVPLVKFGSIRKDGTIIAPPSMRFVSIKFLVTHYFRLTEKQANYVCYSFTILFGITGLIIA